MKQFLFMASIALFSFTAADAQCSKKSAPCCTKKTTLHYGGRQGTIDPREQQAIKRQQQDVRLATRVALSDGYLSPEERRIIRKEKDQVNHTVYRAHNNNRTRY